jgi:hypothetical protein
MNPLNDAEASFLFHLSNSGTGGYPITQIAFVKKSSGEKRFGFIIRGFPQLGPVTVYETKVEAIDAINAWADEAAARLQEMKAENPGVRVTAGGVRNAA